MPLAKISSTALWAGLTFSCKTSPEKRPSRHRTWPISKDTSFSLLSPENISLEAIETLHRHLPVLVQRLQKFDLHLKGRVGLFLYADGYRFARTIGHSSAALRAWTTPRQIHLLLVDEDEKSARENILKERFVHEACHAALFEICAAKRMPSWWQEGVASVVAQQKARRLSLEKLGLLLERRALKLNAELLKQKIYTEEAAFIRYALSHHVLEKACEYAGFAHVAQMAQALSRGENFDLVFEEHVGLSVQTLLSSLL